jgi:CheY-like chemotaxis protein
MEKILSNLLSNAFKFTGGGGKVTVTVTEFRIHNSEVRSQTSIPRSGIGITISDTGIGIPEAELPHIFDRFYQVDGSQTRAQEGTGIGLALVKELVDIHRGTISVRSEVGKRTDFTLQFPLGRAHLKDDEIVEQPQQDDSTTTALEASVLSDAGEQSAGEEPEPAEHQSLILVVEDNADVRSYIRGYLDPTYRVLEASDGDEGINAAIESIPDLIISDVMMPKKDGYELCRILKQDEKTSHIPIILLTAKAGSESKIEGLETGADDYLVKPFKAKEMLVRVKNLIDQRQILREKFQRELIVQPREVKLKSIDEIFLTKALAVIESHLSDANFDTAALAEAVAMSRMQLHRKLRALTNSGPGELIRSFRMKRAGSMLQQKAGNISEVAYEVGYSNPSHFAQVFKDHFGVPPSEYVPRQDTPQQ